MIQLFSIRMIRPVGFGYKDDNRVLSLYKKRQGVNINDHLFSEFRGIFLS